MIDTVILDLDGTLYEDPRVYDRYVQELSARLPEEAGRALLRDWELALNGKLTIRIGMGHDVGRDLLFRHDGECIQAYVTWVGGPRPVPPAPEPDPGDPHPPTDIPVFGPERFNIGDLWGLGAALAVHHGIDRARAEEAFRATRAWMDGQDFTTARDDAWLDTIRKLRRAGMRTIAVSNSFSETVERTIDDLGIRDGLSAVVGGAGKPAGMTEYLRGLGPGPHILSIGDNYVNDILPALRLGCRALYIDRHATGLGEGNARCVLVPSIGAARQWVRETLLG